MKEELTQLAKEFLKEIDEINLYIPAKAYQKEPTFENFVRWLVGNKIE